MPKAAFEAHLPADIGRRDALLLPLFPNVHGGGVAATTAHRDCRRRSNRVVSYHRSERERFAASGGRGFIRCFLGGARRDAARGDLCIYRCLTGIPSRLVSQSPAWLGILREQRVPGGRLPLL